MKPCKLYWHSPVLLLLILVNLLVYILVVLIVRKKVVIDVPVSEVGRKQLAKHRWISAAIGLSGVGMLVFSLLNLEEWAGLALLAIPLVLTSLVYLSYKGTLVRITKMKGGYVWLSGASPDLVASLPKYTGAAG